MFWYSFVKQLYAYIVDLQFIPSFLWSADYNKINYPSATNAGLVGRQLSNQSRGSTELVDDSGIDYVYNLDTCQTIYLVEKHPNGNYEVTILYTKEVRLPWIEAKIRVILLRILIAEKNIPVLNNLYTQGRIWRIIGSIDCQADRSYSVNQFQWV